MASDQLFNSFFLINDSLKFSGCDLCLRHEIDVRISPCGDDTTFSVKSGVLDARQTDRAKKIQIVVHCCNSTVGHSICSGERAEHCRRTIRVNSNCYT